jgi:hypothetical protein
MKRLTTISMFKNKLKTGGANGADIRVQLIWPKILEEIRILTATFFTVDRD